MNNLVWMPKNIERTAMMAFMNHVRKQYQVQLTDYQSLHTWSITAPALFWEAIANFFQIDFKTPPQTVLKQTQDMRHAMWFEGATFNVTAHLLKRADDHPALISINEIGERTVYSYRQLKHQVACCASALKAHGVCANDRVVGMLPNSAYAVIAMLATAKIGAIWSSCSPDFGVTAAIDRFSQITPTVLLISDGYVYHGKTYHLQDKARALLAHIPSLKTLVVCPSLKTKETFENAVDWNEFIATDPLLDEHAFPFQHPWYILFSSGTTGQPKCIVHSTGGTLLQHLKELSLHTNLHQTDTLFFHTTCGWMMWNWMVSALSLGATLVLYDGSPLFPEANRMFQILDEESVNVFGTSARFLASIEKRGIEPNTSYRFQALRTILSTGSPLLPEQYDFVQKAIHPDIQLSSISGGTDIISCFALGNPISPVYRGELQCLGLGMDVQIFDEQGQAIQAGMGELVCTQPFPSMPIGFWNDHDRHKYQQAYFERFPGVWAHGDLAARTIHHGLIIYGRSDAVLNPGGVRIGTAEIYRPLEKIPEIIDSVVIGQPWQGDIRIVLFVKLRSNQPLDNHLCSKIRQTIREEASPRHVPSKILAVPDIPRTMNGKLVEVAVRQTVQGEPIQNIGMIANPEALAYFKNRPELLTTTEIG